ncbi:MAG TPA: FixH family protein [Luteimonas sp.]|nr:FixH family protein [Luteimonas sp.]
MDEKKRHALREPMVWLVIALPLAAVIASIWLVVASSRGGSVDSVADEVQRTGQIQVTDLGPDERAARLKLGAVLQSENGMLRVFPAGGRFRRDTPLRLTLLHLYSEDADQVLVLQPDKLGWHVEHAAEAGHDWNLQLTDEAGSWRLRGRLPRGQHAAHLGPALEAK